MNPKRPNNPQDHIYGRGEYPYEEAKVRMMHEIAMQLYYLNLYFYEYDRK